MIGTSVMLELIVSDQGLKALCQISNKSIHRKPLSRTKSRKTTLRKVSVFGIILVRIFPHSDFPNAGNTDQNNSDYGHFLRSATLSMAKVFFHVGSNHIEESVA